MSDQNDKKIKIEKKVRIRKRNYYFKKKNRNSKLTSS